MSAIKRVRLKSDIFSNSLAILFSFIGLPIFNAQLFTNSSLFNNVIDFAILLKIIYKVNKFDWCEVVALIVKFCWD